MIYILIPAHNNKNEVLDLLGCLHRQTFREHTIVLVDDGSTDNTAAAVKQSFPATIILKGDGNLWWTGANILGVNYILEEARDDDFVLLLNNDLIVDDVYIENLITSAQLYPNTLIGSTLVDYDDRSFLESGVRFDRRLQLEVNRDVSMIQKTEYDANVDALPGRGTLIPVIVYRKIGNFNVKMLPHYGADYEFSVRAKRAGFKLLVSHRARVYAKLNITGYGPPDKKFISFHECWKLLFSKKSKTNIYYYNNFVWLCSEPGYRVKNVINSTMGNIYQTVFRTRLFYPARLCARFLIKGYKHLRST